MTTKPAHFEVLTRRGDHAFDHSFPTYGEAHEALTSDPLISANSWHPYFWGNFFEIVLCGGDGCTL